MAEVSSSTPEGSEDSKVCSALLFFEMHATISFSCKLNKKLKVRVPENMSVGILNKLS